MVLEDDFINAKDIKEIILRFNVNEVDTFSHQATALEALAEVEYKLAFLDVNLKNETCIKVAEFCAATQIPFYYITGYGKSFIEDGNFPDAPVILKPIKTEDLRKIIKKHIL